MLSLVLVLYLALLLSFVRLQADSHSVTIDATPATRIPMVSRLSHHLHRPIARQPLHPVILPFPLTSLSPPSRSRLQTTSAPNATSPSTRLPTVFVSHGGGPSFFLRDTPPRFADIGPNTPAFRALQAVPRQLGLTGPTKPRAILIVSAHWESGDVVRVTSRDSYPELFFDYYGFPPYTYELSYPAPGSSAVASRVHSLLSSQGIPCTLDAERNWDHGAFIPLMVMYPDADVPVVELSLLATLDPATHLRMGEALAPLRDEGVLIVGSGYATHNFSPSGDAHPFIEALERALTGEAKERRQRLTEWTRLPQARQAHPREDHFMPLHVAVGAAGTDAGSVLSSMWVMGGEWCTANYAFGTVKGGKA